MNITRAAIEKNRITLAVLLVVFVAGIGTYYSLPRAEDPGFIIRTAQVTTYFPGASPERVEQLVTDRLEEAIQEMPEIDFIQSISKTGVSVVFVNIAEKYRTMRPIWDDLRRKVNRVSPELPEGVIGPFVNDEFGDVFGTVIMLTGDGFTYAELKEIADEVRSELLLSSEIAKVDIHGIQEERIFVEYNNARLAEFGLSPIQLQDILEARNIIIPGGQIFTDREQIALEPTGNFESVADLRRTVISLPGGNELVYLQDLVDIRREYRDPPRSRVHYNGQPALALAVNLREGGNIVTLGDEVLAQLERFRSMYPIGVEFELAVFQPFYVNKKVHDFFRSLMQAIGIVLLVMLLFLGFRTGLVVASLIPMAMISAIFFMPYFNIGIDQMSIASLIIALGMLVDNAIVMSESIMVQMADGKARLAAAVDSAQELRVPLLTSSLTTAAAFLPMYLAESSTGEYVTPLFKVVTITLLCSWVLSLTMTPLLCVKFLRIKSSPAGGSYNSRAYRIYRDFVIMLLKRRWLTVLGAIVLFALAGQGLRLVPQIFFPPNDKPIAGAELQLPVGTPLVKTEEVIGEIEQFMSDSLMADTAAGEEGIIDWAVFIGEGAPRYYLSYNPEPPSPEYADFILNATSVEVLENSVMPRLEQFCFDRYPDMTPKVELLQLGPPVVNPIEVRLSGRDTEELFRLVDTVKEKLAAIPGIKNIVDNWGSRTKKLVVNVNQARAQRAGLTNRDIAVSLQTILTGMEISEYREQDEVIPIVMRSVAADRSDIGKLESHNIYVQRTGRSVPLKQVADIRVAWEPSKVLRRDRLRTVTVEAGITGGANAIALAIQLDDWLKEISRDWPIGFKYEIGGEKESSGDANQSINEKMPIALLIIVLLLVWQFNSFRKPLIILLTIPLALIGVTVGLLVTGSYFGFMTLLGIISLVGIVINNAIVLIDRIDIEMTENGRIPQDAIVEAAQRRLRPILLTTATTAGGLMPLWFGGAPMWVPMSITIIFGLTFATILTLGLVPVLYSLFYRVTFKGYRYGDKR